MKCEVILSPGEFEKHDLTGKIAVVIDVFRFTTTILTALEAGIESFYPVEKIQQAWDQKEKNPDFLLAGERHALEIPGFDFGNSPLEHRGKVYAGGKLVCCTTNGTKAVQAARGAFKVVLASLRSLKAVARYLEQYNRDVIFLPAGLNGKFSLEDTWCAGLILSYLPVTVWGDGAKVARLIQAHTPLSDLIDTAHGRRLQKLGLWEDLQFCLQCDRSPHVVLMDSKSGWGGFANQVE